MGLSGFCVAKAGQAFWHRAHSVHASKLKSCAAVKSSTPPTPYLPVFSTSSMDTVVSLPMGRANIELAAESTETDRHEVSALLDFARACFSSMK